MGKVTANRDTGKKALAKKQLVSAKVDAAIIQLDAFIDNDSPTNAETLAHVKFQARLLRRILNYLRSTT